MSPRKSARLSASRNSNLKVKKTTRPLRTRNSSPTLESSKLETLSPINGHFKVKKTARSPKTKECSPTFESLEDEVVAVLAALRSNVSDSLPARDEHIEKIDELLRACIDHKESCSIYIYGAPGHGKTASMNMIKNKTHIKNKMKVVYIDCRKLSTPVDVYETIILGLDPKYKRNPKTLNITKISQLIESGKKPTLLILDEMDRLKTQTNSILYSLLELRSTVPAGKIAIIGVGNAQNFIDTLPMIKNIDALEPTLIEFGSYTKDDIKEILIDRLKSVACQRVVFHDVAIELLAAKTAVFGDARVSLGLASSVVQNVFDKADGDDICKIDPLSVLETFSSAFGANEKTFEGKDTIDSLTLPQKLILGSVMLTLKKNLCAVKDLTLTRVYNKYKEISVNKGIEILSQSDFLYACRMVEQQGFFSRKRSSKKSISWDDKILLKVDQTELLDTLMTKPLLCDILSD